MTKAHMEATAKKERNGARLEIMDGSTNCCYFKPILVSYNN